ncbi:tripartite tricarboxylate transporter substrate binding protein [Ramlibacter sp. G-1-2-2]|uniref:Tripartite tricarboxylate transporter substrate binding protein n=1 Tax=Ramlibacter agri TaxID=2728837 RepID=A0A848HIQ1_9BURK|nr:tripartite tricarboxylate transporter substrate binding protein [Ramlibacter agri]NML47598.1 tripartite tricarboxylate transporter substrate binding protein [Ramlibacter agri]
MIRRTLLALLTGLAVAGAASAQGSWPSRPIRVIVPYPPGGPVDSIARFLVPGLSKELGQPIVVDNRAGAAGLIGVAATVNAEPDGYTFGIGALGHFAVQPHVGKVPYKLEDVNYVTLMTQSPHVFIVNPAQGYPDLKSVIEAARKAPGKLNYGSPGSGSSTHLDGELLQQEAKIEIQHVPYKGGPAAVTAMVGGEVQLLSVEVSVGMSVQQKVRIAAVMADKRLPQLPKVPTMVELGYPNVVSSSMYGMIAPKNTPREITEKFRLAVIQALNAPEVKSRLNAQGQSVVTGTPEEFRKLMEAESAKWGSMIKARNIKVD